MALHMSFDVIVSMADLSVGRFSVVNCKVSKSSVVPIDDVSNFVSHSFIMYCLKEDEDSMCEA